MLVYDKKNVFDRHFAFYMEVISYLKRKLLRVFSSANSRLFRSLTQEQMGGFVIYLVQKILQNLFLKFRQFYWAQKKLFGHKFKLKLLNYFQLKILFNSLRSRGSAFDFFTEKELYFYILRCSLLSAPLLIKMIVTFTEIKSANK